MTPEELGRLVFIATGACPDLEWSLLSERAKQKWIDGALAVAAAIKFEDAEICEQAAKGADGRVARRCARRIKATIPEGK